MAVRQPMYEDGALCLVTGGPLRPGGPALTARLCEACQPGPGDLVLDMGCGAGGTVQYLRSGWGAAAVGIDRSGALLLQGRQAASLPLACAAAGALPFAGDSLDVVLAECSFSASSDSGDFLAEARRVLRPGGRLGISDVYVRNPAGSAALRALPFSCGLSSAPEENALMEHLHGQGFTLQLWEDHSAVLKELSRQAVQVHGSANAFWGLAEPGVDPLDIAIAISRAKLGYFLLVAQKMV